jgi:hypothetical protein
VGQTGNQLWLSGIDPTTAVAVEARTTAARPDDHGGAGGGGASNGGGGHHDGGATVGSVIGVDETAGTVTLSVLSRSGATQVTFAVTTDTTISVDGASAALAPLAVWTTAPASSCSPLPAQRP